MTDARQLLAEYARSGSETAFHEVVRRFVDLVYSTAQRLVDNDADLAKDVTQNVFVDLAKMAGSLSNEVMIGGWLHRHTCFLARKTMRTERRRQIRERHAMEMNANDDHAAANLEKIAPALDEAINDLSGPDRAAILARFFEQRDFRGVGEALGGSEEAARKRVNRALDKLEASLRRRGVALSATALAGALGSGAVNAAPAGLAVVVASSAATTVAAGGGTALTLLYIMNVTKTQVAIVGALALALGTPLVMEHRANSKLETEIQELRHVAANVNDLKAENQRLSNLVANAQAPKPATPESSRELMKLRGEVGALRRTAEEANAAASARSNAPSVLSGLTENAEMAKMLRDQQRRGLGAIYKTFTDKMKLPPESTEKLNDLLADNVMTNINHITTVLREGKSLAEMDSLFTAEEKALEQSVKELLGPESFDKYKDYTHNLTTFVSAEQFKEMMEGDKESKETKTKAFYKLMQEETQRALAAAGLPADYQTLPTLNFRNIASEEAGERSLELLGNIYSGVAAKAGSFLTPKDLEKLGEFQELAIKNNRLGLALNRKIMAPPVK